MTIFTRLRLFRDGGVLVVLRCARCYRRHAKRLNLLALKAFKFYFVCSFLTAEKCGEILVALKICIVKFALIKPPCAILNACFACVKFGRAPFSKHLCARSFCLFAVAQENEPRARQNA